ncbi:MAG: DNA polymerase III subunit gamma/tau [Bacteroidia bacterium]
MENFVVSARKYRPARFDTVIGQEHVVNTLKNAIKNHHLAHAFLFCGPRGVGKTTSARLLAKTINCTNLTDEIEACNECESCKSFNNNSSFNVYELDAASNNSVEDIRALVDQVRYAPQGSKYKIYIIDEVHMLSSQAFNAFLKTLEEPPSYAKFILATTEKHKILPTILSRCQIFDFHRIGVNDAVKQLKEICKKENIEAETEALHTIALKADGAMRDALSIFDRIVSFSGNKITYNDVISNLNILDYEYYFKSTNLLLANNMAGMILLFDEILTNGFDGLQYITGFEEHIRNLMVCKFPDTNKLLQVSESVAIKYKQQANSCSAGFLINALNILSNCELNYKQSNNQRLYVELTLLKLCNLLQVINPSAQQPMVDEKKKMIDSSENENATINIQKNQNEEDLSNNQSIHQRPVADIPQGSASNRLEKLKQKLKEQLQNKSQDDFNGENIENEIEEINNNITEDDFANVWNSYIEHLMKSNKTRISSFLNQAKKTLNNHTVLIELRSKLEADLFNEERIEMIPFFRNRLQNTLFEFEVIVNEQLIETTKALTKQEQLKIITDKNPAIATLIQKLGLEIDY